MQRATFSASFFVLAPVTFIFTNLVTFSPSETHFLASSAHTVVHRLGKVGLKFFRLFAQFNPCISIGHEKDRVVGTHIAINGNAVEGSALFHRISKR